MTTHPHPTMLNPTLPIPLRPYPPSRAYRVVADLRSLEPASTDGIPAFPVIGPVADWPDETTPNGLAYIARLDRIMRIA